MTDGGGNRVRPVPSRRLGLGWDPHILRIAACVTGGAPVADDDSETKVCHLIFFDIFSDALGWTKQRQNIGQTQRSEAGGAISRVEERKARDGGNGSGGRGGGLLPGYGVFNPNADSTQPTGAPLRRRRVA